MAKLRSKHLTLALLATTIYTSPALAQQDPDTEFIPPVRQTVDANGVDLSIGFMSVAQPGISIGSGAQGLSYARTLYQKGNGLYSTTDNPYSYTISGTPGAALAVVAGARSVNFTYNSTTGLYDNKQGTGETLTGSGTNWTFTMADGTVVQMDASDFDPTADSYPDIAIARTITFPDKHKLTFAYAHQTVFSAKLQENVGHFRIQSVQSSNGYMAKMDYDPTNWAFLTKVTLLNTAVDYCNPLADSCTFSKTWPSLSFSQDATAGTTSVTDTLSRTTTYTTTGCFTGIRRPGSASDDVTIQHQSDCKVTAVTANGRTWSYAWSAPGLSITATITNPDGTHRTVVTDTSLDEIMSETDELGRTTSYAYDAQGRLTDVTYPEGNKVHYTYDARGNVTQKQSISKTPGTPADIVVSAAYAASCTIAVTCNKPTSTTDPKGNVTNYTYDPTHGGVLTVTSPAPSTGAVRPQTRYGYTALQAYFKNSSGAIVASGQPTYMLTSVSQCQTTASCAGVADEVKSTIGYGATGVANNLLPVTVSSGSGNGSLAATKTVTYDSVGNVTYIDGPLAGTADTTRILYDAGRQPVGQISPDPDGAGSLRNRGTRLTYNPDGLVTKVENGTTAGQSDANWASFSPAQTVDIGRDASGLELTRKLSSGGTTYALTQSSYDPNGRLQCSAVRMNPAVYGSLPADACTQGSAGADGSDRIGMLIYDAAGEVIESDEGVGTPDQAAQRKLTYTNNGNVATLTDGENNKTTYSYDGFDRLLKTQYPGPTKGSGTSSTTDYEQLTYDANGNVTSRRLRDGNSIAFSYDNLDRVTLKNLPGTEPDVSYGYDNLGRLTSASQTGNALSFTYDALSRKLTEAGAVGSLTSQYDTAGRRTSLTTTNGYGASMQYFVTGELKTVSDLGGVLATYAYDNLGNRISRTYQNGTSTQYSFDPISRLTALTHNLAGTTKDLTIGTMTYNAASQITSAPRSNDAYSFTGYVGVSRPYTSNGLNQYVAAGSASFAYDAKGNLTSDGTNTFGYSSENLLISAPGVTLSYDPLGRLYQITSSSGTHNFLWDGLNVIEQISSTGPVQHSFVFGGDEPLVWYDYVTAGGNKRFLSADERGSIVAMSDDTGTLVSANSYDEYDIPGSGNVQLFQYTGQMWLPEIGMQYSRARMFSPTLGRFMQTDPIGYDDNANLYAYTGNDPVNASDPLGLWTDIIVTGCRLCGIEDASSGLAAFLLGNSIEPGFEKCGSADCRPIDVVGHRRPNPTRYPRGGIGAWLLLAVQPNPACTSGRYTLGGQFSATGFLASLGLSGNVEVGVALPTRPSSSWNPFAGIQAYARAQGLGLAGLGFFAGAGVSGVGGISGSPLRTGVQTSIVTQGGFADPAGGEASISLSGRSASVSGGPRAGMGGYLARGAGKTLTLATVPLGCPL